MKRQNINIKQPLVLIILAINIAGCSGIPFEGKDGTIHNIIIGVGVVSTPNKNMNSDVVAIKSQVLGVHLSTHPGVKFGVGYISSSLVEIPEQSRNIIVEVSHTPFGGVSIKANPDSIGANNETR
jgi:hypothetical protein